uniref:Bis(5'-nucleosyl)-tetraphosphatase, symmetrical n=1 Tax=Candidatus Kentrum sp. DK TaxID=2126562 RepID=A0A450SGU3_9GAMM|nr:MAG: Bis(5'nucleosyl)-tetraphosphatase, ApaH [Candidatus Kentron sp. DK]
MATYAIGDIQGCFASLTALLSEIQFDPRNDKLWICGDLVNRGPESARVLRFIRGLGKQAVAVLGNHDLSLLAVAAGSRTPRKKDTYDDVLQAPDGEALIHWLRHRPLFHQDATLGFTMVHAGLPPAWDRETAACLTREVESVLRNDSQWTDFVANMYGNEPDQWSEALTGWDRLRFITNSLTRLRYCRGDGALDMGESGPPGSQEQHLTPWFALPDRRSAGERILFGHWAALVLPSPPGANPAPADRSKPAPAARPDLFGFFTGLQEKYRVYPLDTGCVWGNRLTALRLEDLRYFSVACQT